MFKKSSSPAAFALLVTVLAGCTPVGTRVSGADAGTPIIQVSPVQIIPSPTNTATAPAPAPAAVPATATLPPPSPAQVPVIDVAAMDWKIFNSPSYHYAIAYPSDWTVSVDNPGTMGEATQIETVIFKQPGFNSIDHSSAVTIQAAQHGYATTGQCQNPSEVVPGIKGCRRSFPRAQNPALEMLWFQPPLASTLAQPYFDIQLIYDEAAYVDVFNRMLRTFKYTGLPVTGATVVNCTYKAAFLADVTIPDNTVIAPGAHFIKTWRVRNDGTCPWGAGTPLHQLTFVGGDQLGAPAIVGLSLPHLEQGGTVDISMSFVAPVKPGTYQSNWRLRDENSPQIGMGTRDAPLYVQIIVPEATPVPSAWKTYTSSKHHYVVSYPADWTIKVQTSGPGHDPEYVDLRASATSLPAVHIYALKDAPPITGFENCDKNLQLKGVAACSISLPKGQIPATQLLVFQKGESHYHLAMEYEVQQQLAVFEEIVKSFQFTQ